MRIAVIIHVYTAFVVAVVLEGVTSYSVGSVDHSGSCTYNFQVWTPDQDIINRIQHLETRCDNISSSLKAELSNLRHLLESQQFISQNVTNNYERQILQYKFDDVKLDTAIKDLKLELMENRAETAKIWAFLNQLQSSVLKSLISNSNNVMATEQSVLSNTHDHDYPMHSSKDGTAQLIPQLKNSVGDLKAEWLLIKREVKDIKSASSQIKSNMNDMEEDTMTLKSNLDLVKNEVKILKGVHNRLNASIQNIRQEIGGQSKQNVIVDWGEIPYDDEIYDGIEELREKYNVMKSEIENISQIIDSGLRHVAYNNNTPLTDESPLPANFVPRDCHDIYKQGYRTNGVYQIKPDKANHLDHVYCEMINNTGWIVLQRRQDGMLSFSRMWLEYKFGFGNLYGEFWLGNEMMYWLTAQKEYMIRIDMWDWEGGRSYAEYDYFHIDSEETYYQLKIGRYSGNAGDSLKSHDERSFSTEDSDNDLFPRNCAAENKGGWWFHSCYDVNLNGIYRTGRYGDGQYADGIVWFSLKNTEYYSLKKVEMKIRPIHT